MTKIITNVFSIRLRKLSSEYKALYERVYTLQGKRKDLELQILKIEREIFDLNRKIDTLEEEIINDIEFQDKTDGR